MSNTENKTENPSTKVDRMKTGIVENKKSLESLADHKVDGENILGGTTINQEPSGISSENPRRRKMESDIHKSKI